MSANIYGQRFSMSFPIHFTANVRIIMSHIIMYIWQEGTDWIIPTRARGAATACTNTLFVPQGTWPLLVVHITCPTTSGNAHTRIHTDAQTQMLMQRV